MRRKNKPWYDGPIGRRLRDVWWDTVCVDPFVRIVLASLMATTTLTMILLWLFKANNNPVVLIIYLQSLCSSVLYWVQRSKQRRFFDECGLDPDHAWRLIREWQRCTRILPDQAIKRECQWSRLCQPEAKHCDDGRFEVRYGSERVNGTNHEYVAHAGRWLMAVDQAQQEAANRIASYLIDQGFIIDQASSQEHPTLVHLTWPALLQRPKQQFHRSNLSAWESALAELPGILATYTAAQKAAEERAARELEIAKRIPDALEEMQRILAAPPIPAASLSPATSGEINDASLTAAEPTPGARLTGGTDETQPVSA
jgi:hypothetical protein